jgi:cardiolipin synthase C
MLGSSFGYRVLSLGVIASLLTPAFAQEQSPGQDKPIPEVADMAIPKAPSIEELEAMPAPPPSEPDLAEYDPSAPPPPPVELSAKLAEIRSFARELPGHWTWLSREYNLRKEACEARHLWDDDSVEDYRTDQATWMPAKVKVLADPNTAFVAKYMAIRQAKASIRMNTYIFDAKHSDTTKTLMYEMGEAIKRGVDVSLTIDSAGSGLGTFDLSAPFHGDVKSLLAAPRGFNKYKGRPAQVHVVIFKPTLKFKNLVSYLLAKLAGKKDPTSIDANRRSHDKILLVDAEMPEYSVAVVGGRNWSDHYFGIPGKLKVDSNTYEDMEVVVRDNPYKSAGARLADTVGAHHRRLLCHKGNRWLWSSSDQLDQYRKSRDEVLGTPEVQLLLSSMGSKTDANAYINDLSKFEDADVRWLNEIHNIRRPIYQALQDPDREAPKTDNANEIVQNSLSTFAAAKKRVAIVTPYLYLSTSERARLIGWARADKNRELHIVSNSKATSDNAPAQVIVDRDVGPDFKKFTDSLGRYRGTPRAGFFEFGKTDGDLFVKDSTKYYGKLHAKYWTVDGLYSFVGTHNFDPRSRYLNSEVGFLIRSPKIAGELDKSISATIDRSELFGTPAWLDLANHPILEGKRKVERLIESVFDICTSCKSPI